MRNLQDRVSQLGFHNSYSVAHRKSVADLFKPGNRTGIYLLAFQNGDLYVGQSINVVNRFHQHKSRFDDIVRLFFAEVHSSNLDDQEQTVIAELEHDFRLRNISLASFAQPERDLDLIVSPEQQTLFLMQGNPKDWHSMQRPDDVDLRQRYRRRFAKVLKLDRFVQDGLPVLRQYVETCLPLPRITELSFWAVSCLPASPASETLTYSRINLFQQEVMTAYDSGNGQGVCFSFHIALNPFDEMVFGDLRKMMEKLPRTVFDFHRYKSGGADQWNIVTESPEDAKNLIRHPVFAKAAREFSLRLMQKGPTRFARYHCFDLADRLLEQTK